MRKPSKRFVLALLASGAAIGLSLPAFGEGGPESLLPPGFGEPIPAPAAPAPTQQVQPATSTTPTSVELAASAAPGEEALPAEAAEADADAEGSKAIELPDAARRPVDLVGPLTPELGGLGTNAFGRSDGRFLTLIMRHMKAPVASRWTSILLRRALLSRVPVPANAVPADWVADRALLLLRMGEADAARILVENVDVDRYSPRLLLVARQAALATADPAMMCPLVDPAARRLDDRNWAYARAICASLSGEGGTSSMLLDKARGRSARTIDYSLTERVVGAGANTRRAAVIEWNGVDRLTSWRFGMAASVGLDIPKELYATAGPQLLAWRARAPMYKPEDRVGAARVAAVLGVFSNAALVDLYSQVAEREGDTGRDAPAARLRLAYSGDDDTARMAAIRSFWSEADTQPGGLYAAEILTARAAARIAPDESFSADYTKLIAAMMSAGLDRQAARWASIVQASSPSISDQAWALLAVGAPRRVVDLGYGRIDGYGARLGAGGAHKMRMLIAGLAGLGRISAGDATRLADRYDLALGKQTSFTRAISRAAARGEQGTVALLAAAGMQTRNWQYVPPAHLYHVVAALRRTGNEPVARMIAAEALSRL